MRDIFLHPLIRLLRPRLIKPLWIMFASVFFLAVSSALITYFLSSYLKTLLEERYVGVIFAIGYIISMVTVNFFPYLIGRLGALKSFLALIGLVFFSLILLASNGHPILLAVFIIYLAGSYLILIAYDVLVEMFSQDMVTGRIRGVSLTLMNLGWVVTPVIAGSLVERFGFRFIFALAALLLIIPFLIVGVNVRERPVKVRYHVPFLKNLKRVMGDRSLRPVFFMAFLLSFFYSWMVIYTPLHLLNLGYDFRTIGIIFSIMLIPFVLIQYPAGWLADKFLGETEMLSLGLIICGLATFAFFYFSTPVAITLILFTTRIGAALIEEMSDSYFYKQVSAKDVGLISSYRNTRPFAYVVSPLLATAILYFLPMAYLFPILGGIMLMGLFFTFVMPDTK